MIIYSPIYIKKFDYDIVHKVLSDFGTSSLSSSLPLSLSLVPLLPRSSSSSPSPSSLCNNNLKVILATSSSSSSSSSTITINKRGYYDDYKDFKEAFTMKSIGIQLIKALLLESSLASLRYTEHLELQAEAQNNGFPTTNYDWSSRGHEHINKFAENSIRFILISWIKKSLELYAYYNVNPRMFSRLTKDINKSIKRKLGRMGRALACFKDVKSCFYSSVIGYSAGFICDVIFNAYDSFANKRVYTNKQMLIFTVKRVGNYLVILVSTSIGHAAGSYIGGINLGGTIGQIVGESGGALVGTFLFNRLEALIFRP